jgi:hypothetical protein
MGLEGPQGKRGASHKPVSAGGRAARRGCVDPRLGAEPYVNACTILAFEVSGSVGGSDGFRGPSGARRPEPAKTGRNRLKSVATGKSRPELTGTDRNRRAAGLADTAKRWVTKHLRLNLPFRPKASVRFRPDWTTGEKS